MNEKHETPLERAIKIAGGITKLSKRLGLSGHAVVYQWGKTRVPAEQCPDIESITGIKCEELRPDVNWAVLRNHPIKRTVAPVPIAQAATETVAGA